MVKLEKAVVAAGFAPLADRLLLGIHYQISFGIVTFWTEHEFADEPVE